MLSLQGLNVPDFSPNKQTDKSVSCCSTLHDCNWEMCSKFSLPSLFFEAFSLPGDLPQFFGLLWVSIFMGETFLQLSYANQLMFIHVVVAAHSGM